MRQVLPDAEQQAVPPSTASAVGLHLSKFRSGSCPKTLPKHLSATHLLSTSLSPGLLRLVLGLRALHLIDLDRQLHAAMHLHQRVGLRVSQLESLYAEAQAMQRRQLLALAITLALIHISAASPPSINAIAENTSI